MTGRYRRFVAGACVASLLGAGGILAAPAALAAPPGIRGHGAGLGSIYADAAPPSFPDGTPVEAAARWLGDALAVRNARLSTVSNELATSRTLDPATRSALTVLVSADASGIAQLVAALPSDTTLAALESTAGSMVVDYRVFAVVAPVVTDELTAANQLAGVAALAALEPAIEAAITADRQSSKASGRAQLVFRELTTELAAITAADGATKAELLALRPASYPASTATLATASSALAGAAARLVTARQDLRRIVTLLAARGL